MTDYPSDTHGHRFPCANYARPVADLPCTNPNGCTERFTVSAMHKPSNGFDGPTQVDYWRIVDGATGERAEGTDKYATSHLAVAVAAVLNGPTCSRCGAVNVEDDGDHADQTGHWPTAADNAAADHLAELAEIGQDDLASTQ